MFARRVRRTIEHWRMLEAGDRILVAVSGGPDSVALLAVLCELSRRLRIRLEAAHYNHRLRLGEAERDQACAAQVADQLRLPFHCGAASDVSRSGNIEEHARVARYDFLRDLAGRLGCRRIATGHTRDDQAETLLMRLVRGSGLDGLGGIAPVRADGIIRPLIDCEREDVLAYLRARGSLPFCEDSMNSDRRFLRSRIRHEVVPQLRAINPHLARTLARVAEVMAAASSALDEFTEVALQTCVAENGELDVKKLLAQPVALRGRLLRRWLAARRGTMRGVGFAHVRALRNLAEHLAPAGEVRLPHGGAVVRDYANLRFEREASIVEQPFGPWRTDITPGSRFELADGWQVSAELVGSPDGVPVAERTLWHFWADADAVGQGLVLRSVRKGDRIEPLGGPGGRKLQDVFVDRKVPRSRRWCRPALESHGQLLWVPGVVRSRHALISRATKCAWRVVIAASGVAGS